jgi:alanine racemase
VIHRVRASIKLNALRHNLGVARQHAGKRKLLAVIKANAYGHGLIPAAEALATADAFGVTDINEAEHLATTEPDIPIVILQGIIEESDVPRIAKGGFQVIVHREQDLQWLESYLDRHPPAAPLTFWLKMNSGMGRLGIQPENFIRTYQLLKAKSWCQDVILMTHLASGNLLDAPLNAQQVACFNKVTEALPAADSSLPATSALLAGIGQNATWVRPGIMLYGSSPYPYADKERRREAFGLQAVMTMQARLIAIQDCKAGDNVGYCSQFICPRDMRIGIVSIGYADGYPSNAPNGTPVLVDGIRTVTTGRVSMDMIAIDLSPAPGASLDSTVTLWGEDLSLDEVAEHTGILSYNLTCSVAPRVERLYG